MPNWTMQDWGLWAKNVQDSFEQHLVAAKATYARGKMDRLTEAEMLLDEALGDASGELAAKIHRFLCDKKAHTYLAVCYDNEALRAENDFLRKRLSSADRLLREIDNEDVLPERWGRTLDAYFGYGSKP